MRIERKLIVFKDESLLFRLKLFLLLLKGVSKDRKHAGTDLHKSIVEMHPIIGGDDAHNAGFEVILDGVKRIVHFHVMLPCEQSYLLEHSTVLAHCAHLIIYGEGEVPNKSVCIDRHEHRDFITHVLELELY